MRADRSPVTALAGRATCPVSSVPPAPDPGLYGLEFADGLPGFQGCLASRGHGAAGEYVAGVCAAALQKFQFEHHHAKEVLAVMETALRRVAQQLSSFGAELDARRAAVDRLRVVAQTGIHSALRLEPYGSFVSGLYTPQGDLDLSLEGTAMWPEEDGSTRRVAVQDMDRAMQVTFLQALASQVEAAGLARGRIERILHARVPILKFQEKASGLQCDVGIGAGSALFKSAVLGLLAQYDWRMGALVRLVKFWARRHKVNDSVAGTFNSFALTLMVIFHLQTRSPPVLPALCELFAGPYPKDAPRPLEGGKPPDFQLLKRAATYLSNLSRNGGYGNSETLLELLTSFFAFGAALCGPEGWGDSNAKAAPRDLPLRQRRRARLDTWAGQLRDGQWEKKGYLCSIEDPFDRTDNCARTVWQEDELHKIAAAFATAEARLRRMPSLPDAEDALVDLFGSKMTWEAGLHGLLVDPLCHSAVQWVPPVDLIMPPRLQHHITTCMPPTVRVDHRRQRGAEAHAAIVRLPLQQRQQPRQQLQLEAVKAGAEPAVEGHGQLAATEASREARTQRTTLPRHFGHVMKRLWPAAGDEATWAAAFAALSAAERVVLQRRGVASYKAYHESQRQYQQAAKQGVAAGQRPPGRTRGSQGSQGGRVGPTPTAAGASKGLSGAVLATAGLAALALSQ